MLPAMSPVKFIAVSVLLFAPAILFPVICEAAS